MSVPASIRVASKIPFIGKYVSALYEAALWKWGERSWIPGAIQDARLDADSMSRKEILRKARYFEANDAFVNRLADIFEQYTVGAGGLPAVSGSKDATDYFNRWCPNCDALGLMDFGTMQGVASRAWFIDGDHFIVKVLVKGRLKVQLVEAHRVYTPPSMAGEEGKSVIDGVGVDSNGRVTGIWVNKAPETPYTTTSAPVQSWQFVPASDFVHVYEPSRAAMYRGLSMLHPVMNDLNDLSDLQMLTMQVAKQAATIGNVTTNRTGELSTQDSRRTLLKIQSTNAANKPLTKNSADYYNVKLGSAEIALQHGDSISQFQANRPSLVEQQHWDYLLSKVCAGVGISKLLVLPYSMQGTVTRADLDIAAAFFRARSFVMQSAVRQVFLWVIEWAADYDRDVLRGGFNFDGYQDVTVRPPRSVNVDVGRNSKAIIAELEAKTRTYQDEYAEQGKDWRTQFDKVAEAKKYAESKGISLAELQAVVKADAEKETPEETVA